MNMLEQAIALAVTAHAGQKDKVGAPYILHPLRLMCRMETNEERMAAVLHDVVEDTSHTPWATAPGWASRHGRSGESGVGRSRGTRSMSASISSAWCSSPEEVLAQDILPDRFGVELLLGMDLLDGRIWTLDGLKAALRSIEVPDGSISVRDGPSPD